MVCVTMTELSPNLYLVFSRFHGSGIVITCSGCPKNGMCDIDGTSRHLFIWCFRVFMVAVLSLLVWDAPQMVCVTMTELSPNLYLVLSRFHGSGIVITCLGCSTNGMYDNDGTHVNVLFGVFAFSW